jgi:hypothetical protein
VPAIPGLISSVRANRAFLARTVRYLAKEQGIRQFLDIGTGIPASNNTHEVAQSVAPDARVVYVDNDRFKSGCAHALCGVGGHVPLPGRLRLRDAGKWLDLAVRDDSLVVRHFRGRPAMPGHSD